MTPDRYIPALGHAWLTGFYDPVLRATMREATFKSRLVAQAELRPGHRVLDIGCGTATLTIEIKRSQPEAEVVGLDGDPDVLRRAAAKVAAAGLTIASITASAIGCRTATPASTACSPASCCTTSRRD
jgi:precorrin-6B methylase 2